MNEIDNIDKLNLKNFKHLKSFDFDNNNLYGRERDIFDGTPIDQEQINIISEDNIEYDASQMKIIQNTRLLINYQNVTYFLQVIYLNLIKYLSYFLIRKIQ